MARKQFNTGDIPSAADFNKFAQMQNDTAANWTSANPVLALGDVGYETDTKKLKIGDGATAWSALPYRLSDPANMNATGGTIRGSALSSVRYVPRVAFIGDSIAAGLNVGYYNGHVNAYGDSPGGYAYMASDGRWDLVQVAGVGGQTSAQILARIQSDIVAAGVNICVINACYYNDVGQFSGTPAQIAAQNLTNITAMCTQLLAAGIQPILCSPTPDGRTGSTATRINIVDLMQLNVRKFALDNGIPFINLRRPLLDPATGTISTTYNADGSVHPTAAGFQLLGTTIQSYLDSLVGPCGGNLIESINDPTDMLAGKGMFATNTGGVGTGWSYTGATGATASIVTDGAVLGSMQRIAAVGSSGSAFNDIQLTGISGGDVIEISGIATTTGDPTKCVVRLVYNGISFSNYVSHNPGAVVTRGRFRYVQQLPAGFSSVYLRQQVNAGTATLDVGQLSVRNLTTLGVSAV